MGQSETVTRESTRTSSKSETVDQEGPATPDLTRQANKAVSEAKESSTSTSTSSKVDNGTKSENFKKQASEVKNTAQDQASKAKDQAQDNATKAKEEAQKVASKATSK